MQKCNTCGLQKPTSGFYPSSKTVCKLCKAASDKARQKAKQDGHYRDERRASALKTSRPKRPPATRKLAETPPTPAFKKHTTTGDSVTVLDTFAAAALTAFLARGSTTHQQDVADAYEMARMMMAERSKAKNQTKPAQE